MLVRFWVVVFSVVVSCQVGQCFNFPQRLGVAKVVPVAVRIPIAPKVLMPLRSSFKLSAYDSKSERNVAELTQDVRKLKSNLENVGWIFRGLLSLVVMLMCGKVIALGGDPVEVMLPCWYIVTMISVLSNVFFS